MEAERGITQFFEESAEHTHHEDEEVSNSVSAATLLAILAVIVAVSIGFEHGKETLFHIARRGTGVSLVNTLFGGADAAKCPGIFCHWLASHAELTLLGFIGLLVYSVQRADLLDELSALLYGEHEADFLPEMTGKQLLLVGQLHLVVLTRHLLPTDSLVSL
jgi:hypothetical protein